MQPGYPIKCRILLKKWDEIVFGGAFFYLCKSLFNEIFGKLRTFVVYCTVSIKLPALTSSKNFLSNVPYDWKNKSLNILSNWSYNRMVRVALFSANRWRLDVLTFLIKGFALDSAEKQTENTIAFSIA